MNALLNPENSQGLYAQNPVAGPDGLPPVKTILSSLLWLSARRREQPDDPRVVHTLRLQVQRLVLHPDATREDLAVAFRLAGAVCLGVLTCLAGTESLGQGASLH